jgi:hypothetical protein
MANRDHIAITSGDASTTRRKVSVPECPVAPPLLSLRVILAILIVASRRIRKYCPASIGRPSRRPAGLVSPAARRRPPRIQLACSKSANARQRRRARLYIATASSRSPRAAPSTAARISATDWSAQSVSSLARWTSPP